MQQAGKYQFGNTTLTKLLALYHGNFMGLAGPDKQLQKMDICLGKKQVPVLDDAVIFSGCTETFQYILN